MFGMLGTVVNTAAVILGGLIGLLLKKGISEKLSDTVFKGLGLCTMFIGITGIFQDNVNTLVVIICVVAGSLLGELIDLDDKINQLGLFVEGKFRRQNGQKLSIAQGFVTASLLFCVGAMTIVGSLQSGLSNDHTTLFTKSILDFVAAIIFASSLGVGVLFSAAFVFIYQGVISFGAYCVASAFSGTAEALTTAASNSLFMVTVNTMNCVGYIVIIGLSLNMIGITKLKVMNYVPAIFLPVLLCPLAEYLSTVF